MNKRLPLLLGVVMMTAGLAMVVHIKHKVQHLQSDMYELERQVRMEEDAIHVLQAEWSYLNKPERLQQLSQKYLNMDTIQVAQVYGNIEQNIQLAENTEEMTSLLDVLEDEATVPMASRDDTPFFAPVSEVQRLFARP